MTASKVAAVVGGAPGARQRAEGPAAAAAEARQVRIAGAYEGAGFHQPETDPIKCY